MVRIADGGRGRAARPGPMPGNPGAAGTIRHGGKSRRARARGTARVAEALAEILTAHRIRAEIRDSDWVVLPESGYELMPLACGLLPLDDGRVQTITTIQAHHPDFLPDGIFDYQYGSGADVREALEAAFVPWANTDLVTLVDAASERPVVCPQMIFRMPEREGRPTLYRKATLGPVAHYRERPTGSFHPVSATDEPDHIFCPCCFATRSLDALHDLVEPAGIYGIRFVAIRNREGIPLGECRANGQPHEPGAAAVRAYAASWPESGYELRKQSILIQDCDGPPPGVELSQVIRYRYES